MSVLKDVTSNGADIATEATASTLAVESGGNLAAIATSSSSLDGKAPALVGGRVPVDASGVAVPVTDNGGSLTVDGTVAVSSVAGNVAITAASLPLPTGAATSALQGAGLPGALGAGGGLIVDGSGTALPVSGTVAVSGSVAVTGPLTDAQLRASDVPVSLATLPSIPTGANTIGAVTGPGAVALATSSNQTSGAQKTQIVDGAGAVIAATSNALNTQLAGITFTLSANNSSAAQLAAGATFTGVIEAAFNQPAAQLIIVSDQPVTVNFDQYDGANNLVSTDTFTRDSAGKLNENVQVNGDAVRVRVTNNGTSTTTTLRIETTYGPLPPLPRALTNAGNLKVAVVEQAPTGYPWQIKGSLSHTPTVITDTFPPHPLLAYKVPLNDSLLFTGGVYHTLAATIEYVRVCRRYFLFGYQATAAPAAPAAPTTALAALTDGIGTAGAYTWKVAPVDTFDKEGALSAASTPALTLTSTNRGATITPPALGSGVVAYNVYRTLADGATYYYVGTTLGASAYIDALPDSAIDTTLTPSVTWATGSVTGETATGPVEMIIEVGAVALTGAPTHLVYKDEYGRQRAIPTTFPTTVGQRIRAKAFGETSNFVAVPVVAGSANLWRGQFTSDQRSRHPQTYGASSVSGVNAVPSAGSFIVWGQQVIGVGVRTSDPVLGTIHSYQIVPTQSPGVLIPSLGEIVVEIGALAAGVAGVRDVTLSGLISG